MEEVTLSYEQLIAEVKKEMVFLGLSDFPTFDLFTPGLYVRTVHIPAGSFVLSERHKTIHPYMLSQGSIKIFTEDGGTEVLHAPYMGVTRPGIRFAQTLSDVIWTTFHSTKVMPKDDSENSMKEAVKKVRKKTIIEDKLLINNKLQCRGLQQG
jgi:hypothetical protein